METLEIDGHRLSYTDTGSGRPLVFVHGVGTSGEIWAEDLAPLAEDCRLIVYDRRGYGDSGPSPRDWREHRADAEGLIEALDAAPAVVVGYSGGSMIALPLALERPDLVSSLVLLDPAFNVDRCRTAGFVRAVLGAKLRRRLLGERRGAERWMRYVAGYSTGGSAYDKISPERRERLLGNASGVFDDYASSTDDVDESRLASIAAPVTLIDAALSPDFLRRSCSRLARLLPQATPVTLEQSGHYVGVDARDELLALLREAVRDVPASP
jgi:pimeloyl-ACP methyl ester carboxylesterase